MNNVNLAHGDIIDLVFRNRNKAYGAYQLRKTYHKRLIQSMLVTVGLALVILLAYFVDFSSVKDSKIVEVKAVTLADVDEAPKDIPPPPPPPMEQPKIEVKKFTELLLEKKENLKPEEVKPDINLDELVDANIGKVEVEGVKSTTLAPPPEQGENFIFSKVEINAEPQGGFQGWTRYLRRNLNSSVGVDNGAPPGRYTVTLQFVVEKDGSLTDIKTVGKKHGFGMEEEAIRVHKEGPPWTPGQQNGKIVRSRFTQNITFLVEVD